MCKADLESAISAFKKFIDKGVTRSDVSQMMLDAEEEALPMPLPPKPETFPQAENQAPARKVVRKIADEFLNLSIKIGGKEQLDKYVEDYETFNGKGQPPVLHSYRNILAILLTQITRIAFPRILGDAANKLLADDILRTLINEKKMTKLEAGVVFKIGSGRWHRIKKVVPVDQPVEIRLPYGRNGSQMEEREMQVLSNFVESLQTTEAFPCNHRKIKKYLADVDSWKSLWDSYKVFAEGENRVMQYSTFHKYIRSRHSEFALIKSKEEDDCETCFRLKTIIHGPRVREEDKEAAKTRLKEHSIEERAMTSHIKEAIKLYGKDLLLNKDRRIISEFMRAVDCIPETFDEPMRDLIVYNRTTGVDEVVRLQSEGFSTPFNMPYHSGRKRGMDDSLSAVSLHTYVINDFHTGLNRMYMYDERTLGEDLDSISSIRFLHHMRIFIGTRSGPKSVKQPDVLYLLMDESVGPEKSQEGLMFYVILSLLFYKKVVCHYYPESHSTMCADRAVTHARRIFGGAVNEFHPTGLVAQLNDVSGKYIQFLIFLDFFFIYFFSNFFTFSQNSPIHFLLSLFSLSYLHL